MAYWYNMSTKTVETDETKGRSLDMLGPYETAEEAARALEIAHEKSEKFDETEAEFNESADFHPFQWDSDGVDPNNPVKPSDPKFPKEPS